MAGFEEESPQHTWLDATNSRDKNQLSLKYLTNHPALLGSTEFIHHDLFTKSKYLLYSRLIFYYYTASKSIRFSDECVQNCYRLKAPEYGLVSTE